MKKGQILEQVKIDHLGRGGVGIARALDGKKILIKGALPGSIVDIKIIQRKRSYLTAHIIKVHEVADERIDGEVKCPHYFFPYTQGQEKLPEYKTGCGGCKWQIMSYDKQLSLKQELVMQCFHGMDIEILPILGSPQVFGYRNKIEFSFGKYLVKKVEAWDKKPSSDEKNQFSIAEHWQLGFHKQGQFSKVVDVDQCYLISEHMHAVYSYLKDQLEASGLPVYDAKVHQGVLRHLVIREGVHTEQIMVNLSYASEKLLTTNTWKRAWNNLLKDWKHDAFLQKYVSTFVLTENNGLADVVRGQDIHMEVLRGEGKIFEELHIKNLKTRFQVSPFSFFQTNTLGAEVLFSTTMKMLGEVTGNIIDIYCGSGTIGLTFLQTGLGKAVKGIEVVESAVADAKTNAKINHLNEKSDFFCGKAEKILLGVEHDIPSVGSGTLDDFLLGDDVVIVDPPREGLHPKVVDFLINLKQQASFRLLYISCNPTTMARDIFLLKEGGYTIHHIQPVDMFPQTHHVECITVLT